MYNTIIILCNKYLVDTDPTLGYPCIYSCTHISTRCVNLQLWLYIIQIINNKKIFNKIVV